MAAENRLPITVHFNGSSFRVVCGDKLATLYVYFDDRDLVSPSHLPKLDARDLVVEVARALRAAWQPPPDEALLYTVESLGKDGSRREAVLARVHYLDAAHAAFASTVVSQPYSHLILRKAALELERHVP